MEPLGFIPSAREAWAILAVVCWLGLCWVYLTPLWRARSNRQADQADWLIAYASQSGSAQRLAEQYASALRNNHLTVALSALNGLQPADLAEYSQALLIVSTYGAGETPDNAAVFWSKARSSEPDLRGLKYALLALGDSQYPDFCAFAHHLHKWLNAAGAQSVMPIVEVDQMDSQALQQWQDNVSQLTNLPISVADDFSPWTLSERQLLNPNSPGAPAWLIRLRPVGEMPCWQAGDLAQLQIGNWLRSYSIANLPVDGMLELIVRQVIHEDGSLGRGSGWLCCDAQPGSEVLLRLQSNPQFHLPDTTAPSILIGAGTGLAGLRGLLKQRQLLGQQPNWLVFGERCPQQDRWLGDELDSLASQGALNLDRCFSRSTEQAEYVQHRLLEKADQLREWVDQGACIHVCGNLTGMGAAIHQTLQELLSHEQFRLLQEENRYRRDLY